MLNGKIEKSCRHVEIGMLVHKNFSNFWYVW